MFGFITFRGYACEFLNRKDMCYEVSLVSMSNHFINVNAFLMRIAYKVRKEKSIVSMILYQRIE